LMENVILVDRDDNPLGVMEKMEAHKKGELHRAFSVMVYNSRGEILLQKRARNKYHSGGLWTNACCSHPQPGERTSDAVRRRLLEEMGIELEPRFVSTFIYKAELENGLTEHELDHLFVGIFDGEPAVNESEVEEWKFVDTEWLREDVRNQPEKYTYWFRLIIEGDLA